MASLYADENFDYPVVEKLHRLGHDVLTVQEAGQRGGDDPQVLAYAAAAGRAVLTFNHRHFRRLHRLGSTHAGIVSCTRDRDVAGLTSRIDQILATVPSLVGQFLRVTRPAK